MVYLDAFVPANGKCLFDYLPPERAAGLKRRGSVGHDGLRPVQRFGVTKGDDVRWVESHLSRQPYRTFTQPIALKTDAAKAAVRKTYVYCSSPAIGSFDRFATRFRSDRRLAVLRFQGRARLHGHGPGGPGEDISADGVVL